MRELLPLFTKPSHYAGIEDGICRKNTENLSVHIALAFPDAYEVGMSYLGHKILYEIINSHQYWYAERVMAPSVETGSLLQEKNLPLATLETDTPLNKLDAIGFAITHELCYTDVLRMLHLSKIPLRQKDRDQDISCCPLIFAGGGAVMGAEPLSPFLDFALLGDGEELLPEVLELLEKAKKQNLTRIEFLHECVKIPGVYVPSFFRENKDGSLTPLIEDYRPARRIVADLNDARYPAGQICPVGAVHNRLALEIARGCTRGCRFCHAGIVYRPPRERKPENLISILNQCLDNSGFEEVSFLSLSAGDFSALKTFWNLVYKRCADEKITLTLPSLRVGSVDDEIMSMMTAVRRTGVTIAPEAGSQRLRDVINKGITEEEIILHAKKLLEHGWRQVKLYFMIGLPTETDDDLLAIADLCKKIRDAGGKGSPKLAVTAALSPFVPKPFTPFQWEDQLSMEEVQRRINICIELFKKEKQLVLRWHDPKTSFLEGLLSRADRKMADVVEKAWRKGACFCSWTEFFDLKPWQDAMEECGINPALLLKGRKPSAPLPWSHLEAGVSENFLIKERQKAIKEQTTADCRFGGCNFCGACDTAGQLSLLPKTGIKKNRVRLVFDKRDQHNQNEIMFKPIQAANTQQKQPASFYHYRIWHEKLDNFGFLSQLELQSVITRALRRAKFPIAFSQGFHPLPLLSFGRALPVGMQSSVEWFGITFTRHVAPQKILTGLNIILPDGLKCRYAELTEKKDKTLQSISEIFTLKLKNASDVSFAENSFADFYELEYCDYKKISKNCEKTINIRQLLLKWKREGENISFQTDWSYNYLSPLLIVKYLFERNDLLYNYNNTVLKTSQIFENGKKYE